jgi:hypothetical protein
MPLTSVSAGRESPNWPPAVPPRPSAAPQRNPSSARQIRCPQASMGGMSASDAAPLPRMGEVFFDVRGSSRSMRLSWYADTGVAVFSIWQGGMCTGTFRLPIGDLPRMVETLRRGPTDRVSRERPTSRSRRERGGAEPAESPEAMFRPPSDSDPVGGWPVSDPRAYPDGPGAGGDPLGYGAEPIAGGDPLGYGAEPMAAGEPPGYPPEPRGADEARGYPPFDYPAQPGTGSYPAGHRATPREGGGPAGYVGERGTGGRPEDAPERGAGGRPSHAADSGLGGPPGYPAEPAVGDPLGYRAQPSDPLDYRARPGIGGDPLDYPADPYPATGTRDYRYVPSGSDYPPAPPSYPPAPSSGDSWEQYGMADPDGVQPEGAQETFPPRPPA